MARIGTVYLESKYYASAGAKTTGEPLLGPNIAEVLVNRRTMTDDLSPEGMVALDALRSYFFVTHGIRVRFDWDRHAGCSMCPCSPGFIIRAEGPLVDEGKLPNAFDEDDDQYQIWVHEDSFNIRPPQALLVHS